MATEKIEIHEGCLENLASIAGINIKSVLLAIIRDEGKLDESSADAEKIASQASDLGVKVFKETVKSGQSFSSAEIAALNAAVPDRQWNEYEVKEDISLGLDLYCPTGACKRFI